MFYGIPWNFPFDLEIFQWIPWNSVELLASSMELIFVLINFILGEVLESYYGFWYDVKTVKFDMLTINIIPDTDVLSWMSIFNLLLNENDFSVPVERHRFSKSHDITLNASFHWHDKCHSEKLEHVIVMITWSGNATIGRKTISGLYHITWHQLQIISLIRLFFICHCCRISHHDTHNRIWKKRYGFYLNKKL